MELTVVFGVMLRGTVPRNGLGEKTRPKAPSQPQTCASLWPLSIYKMGELSLMLPISQAAMGRKHSEKLRNVTGTRLNITLDKAAIASSLDLWLLLEMTASIGWPCGPTKTLLLPTLPSRLTHRCFAGVEWGIAVSAGVPW